MKIIHNSIIALLLLFPLSHRLMAQEFSIPTRKEIKLVNNDSTIITQVLVNEIQLKEVKTSERYYWYSNGTIESNIGGYHGRLLDGKFELFKENNLLIRGDFTNGLKNGTWKYWNKDGGFKETLNWEDGQLDGDNLVYYSSGGVKQKQTYKSGQLKGKFYKWKQNGDLAETGKYRDGKIHGKVYIYTDNGEKKIVKYKNGEKVEPGLKEKKEPKTKKDKESSQFNWFKKKDKEKDKKTSKKEKVKPTSNKEKQDKPFLKALFKRKEEKSTR